MYCDEHGTADYCGECMTEAQDQEIAALRQHAEAMAEALEDLVDEALEPLPNRPLLRSEMRKQGVIDKARSALSAYRAESAKGGA